MNRRIFVKAGLVLAAAPMIVRAESIMRVAPPPVYVPRNVFSEAPYVMPFKWVTLAEARLMFPSQVTQECPALQESVIHRPALHRLQPPLPLLIDPSATGA